MGSGSAILRQQAVRIPLSDAEAERSMYENISRITTATERKYALLDDPDVPLTEVYKQVLDEIKQSFEHRLQQIAGENYYTVATAYLADKRDDWIGALAAYYLETYYRLQELYTVDEQTFFLMILRYPECVTINLSFLTCDICHKGVRYESATHINADLSDSEQEQLYIDCQYSQHKAAEYLRMNVDCIREAFPDPETTPFEERQYGGFIHITGRQGSTFTEILESVSPDPGRFADDPAVPGLVPEGPEAKRAKQTFLTDVTVVI